MIRDRAATDPRSNGETRRASSADERPRLLDGAPAAEPPGSRRPGIPDRSAMDHPVERRRWTGKRVALLALGALLLVLLAFFYPALRRWAVAERSVPLSRVRIGEVSRGDLVRDVSAQGNVVAAFRPTLTSPVRGTVRLEVEAGQEVERGQVLVRIASPELESRLQQERSALLSLEADYARQRILAQQARRENEAELKLARVELEAAERAMERAERLRSEGLLNAVDYEKARDDVRMAGMRLEMAGEQAGFEAETLEFEVRDRASRAERQRLVVADLERQVEELAVRSPVAGLASRVAVNDRDTVTPGQALVTVVDLSAFEVEVGVPESYADEILPGQPAQISFGGRSWAGEVRSISPEVEGSRVLAVVAFTGEVPEGLKQNQRVSTRLLLETRSGVLKVPRGPFLEAGGGRQAYVVEDGIAVLRPIEVGAVSIGEVEVIAGLEEGERIVLSDLSRYQGAERILLSR